MSEAKFCSDCKHHTTVPNTAHLQRCAKFAEEPCVVARGDEDKCGSAGKEWEPQE
jgi:hypothetical protein